MNMIGDAAGAITFAASVADHGGEIFVQGGADLRGDIRCAVFRAEDNVTLLLLELC